MADDTDEELDLEDREDQEDSSAGGAGLGYAPAAPAVPAARTQAIPTSRAPAISTPPTPAASSDAGGKGGVDTGASTPAPAPAATPSAIPRKRAKFDPSSFTPDTGGGGEGELDFSGPPQAPPKAKNEKLSWGDYGNAVWSGVAGMGEDLANAAKFVADKIGASPETQSFIEKTRQTMADQVQKSIEDMSPRAQAAMHASVLGYLGQVDEKGNAVPTPGSVGWGAYLGLSVAQMLPSVVAAVVPGTIAGKATVGLLAKAGVATRAVEAGVETATTAGRVARTGAEMATTGGLFAAQNAGAVVGEISKQIGDASDQELMADPTYAKDRSQGMSVDDAKRAMVNRAGNAVGMAAVIGGVVGAGTGGLLTRGALGAGERGLIGRAAIGAAEGGVAMGAQGGANTALTQQATGKPVDWNAVLANAVSQGLPGVAMGAVGGAMHGGGREAGAPTKKPTESDVKADPAQGTAGDPTTKAALGEALQPEGKPQPGDAAAAAGSPAHQPQPTPPEAQPTLTPAGPTHVAETGTPESSTVLNAGQPASDQAAPAPAPAAGEGRVDGAPPAEAAGAAPPAPTTLPAASEAAPETGTGESAPAESQPGTPPEQAPASESPLTSTRMSAREFTEATHAEQAQKSAVIGPDGKLTHISGGVEGKGPHAAFFEANPDAVSDHAQVTAFPGSLGVTSAELPHTPAQQRVINELANRFRREGAKPENIHLPEPETAPESKSGTNIEGAPKVGETPIAGEGGAVIKPEIAKSEAPGAKEKAEPLASAAETPVQPAATAKAIEASKAKSRRAAAKAAMAKPTGERMKGEGAVAESERVPVTAEEARAPTREAEVEEARAAQVQNLHETLGRVIEVKKGVDPRPIVNRVLRDISERIGRTDGSKDAVAEMLHLWRDGPEGEFPGLATSRKNLGTRLMRELTGHDPERMDIARARAEEEGRKAAEVKRAPSSEAIEETAVAAPETAEGEREASATPTEKPRPKSTDAEKIGNDLLERVLSGEITPEQAHAEYGQRRKEGQKTFKEFVEGRVARAEDQASERAILEQMAKLEQDKTLGANARRNKLESLKKQLERTGPEHANELRERVLSRLEDPVGEATQDAEQARQDRLAKMREGAKARAAALKAAKESGGVISSEQRRARVQGISPEASRFVRAANDPRAVASLIDFWSRRVAAGQPVTTHDFLNFIMNDPRLRQQFKPYHALLNVIKKWIPNREIMTPEEAHRQGAIDDENLAGYHNGSIAGQFNTLADPSLAHLDHMVLNWRNPSIETFVHEALHGITTRYINQLARHDPHGREMQALRAIENELRSKLQADIDAGTYFGDEQFHNLSYALKNFKELHTVLMTSPDMWAYASSKMASPELKLLLQSLGYPATPAKSSIWAHFRNWVRTALGVPQPKSASELTMLDHFLAPLQKITENAARYNEKYLPKDPMLHGMGAPVMDASYRVLSPRAGRMVDDALEHVRPDTGRWGDRFRRFLLPGATSDAIVDRYADILPSLGAWRDAGEAISSTGKKFSDTFSDRVKGITNRWNKLDDPTKLGQLQVDATIAKAHLGDDVKADANDHLKTKAQKEDLAKLQERWNRLSPTEKSLYKDMRDIHGEMYQHLRDAQLTGLVKGVVPSASDNLVGKFLEAAKTKDGLNKFVEESTLVPKEAQKLLKGVADVYSQGYLSGDYFPLRRYGDYVVRVGHREDPENYSVEFFDSHAKAQARRAELISQGVESVHQVARKSTSPIHDLAPSHPAVDELYNTMSAAGMKNAEGVRDILKGILLEHATHSEAARTRMRRRGVKGADINQARILNDEFLNNAARVGYAQHGVERTKALSDLENEVDAHELPGARPGNAIKARAVYDEVQKRSASVDPDNVVQSILSKANSFSFAHALMSPSHMLTSSLEAHTNSLALLGARHGIRAGFALTRALAEASPLMGKGVMNTLNAVRGELKAADWNLLHVMRDRMLAKNKGDVTGLRQLFDALDKSGMVDHTQLQDIRQAANPKGVTRNALGKTWDRFFDLNAASAHAVDVMNKVAIAKAAYDLELRKTGGNRDLAVKYAMDTTRKAMPNYSRVNAPRIATARGFLGPLGAPLFQLKRYGLHMYSVLANLARDMMVGENRWEATKAFAGILATHAMIAGTFTWIADPLRYIGGAYDLISGRKPHDYQNDLRAWMADTFGKEVGEVLSRGVPRALGIDLHQRVGLSNLLEIPELKSFDKKDIVEAFAGAALGAPGEAAADAADGFLKLIHGDIGGFMMGAIPRPLRDLWKAKELAQHGVVTQAGRQVLAPEKLSTLDIARQALGFTPERKAEAYEASGRIQERQAEITAERTRLSKAWVAADPADRAEIMSEIRQFNADRNNLGIRITTDQLMRDLHAHKKQQQAPYGLRLPAHQARAFSHLGDFATVQTQ